MLGLGQLGNFVRTAAKQVAKVQAEADGDGGIVADLDAAAVYLKDPTPEARLAMLTRFKAREVGKVDALRVSLDDEKRLGLSAIGVAPTGDGNEMGDETAARSGEALDRQEAVRAAGTIDAAYPEKTERLQTLRQATSRRYDHLIAEATRALYTAGEARPVVATDPARALATRMRDEVRAECAGRLSAQAKAMKAFSPKDAKAVEEAVEEIKKEQDPEKLKRLYVRASFVAHAGTTLAQIREIRQGQREVEKQFNKDQKTAYWTGRILTGAASLFGFEAGRLVGSLLWRDKIKLDGFTNLELDRAEQGIGKARAIFEAGIDSSNAREFSRHVQTAQKSLIKAGKSLGGDAKLIGSDEATFMRGAVGFGIAAAAVAASVLTAGAASTAFPSVFASGTFGAFAATTGISSLTFTAASATGNHYLMGQEYSKASLAKEFAKGTAMVGIGRFIKPIVGIKVLPGSAATSRELLARIQARYGMEGMTLTAGNIFKLTGTAIVKEGAAGVMEFAAFKVLDGNFTLSISLHEVVSLMAMKGIGYASHKIAGTAVSPRRSSPTPVANRWTADTIVGPAAARRRLAGVSPEAKPGRGVDPRRAALETPDARRPETNGLNGRIRLADGSEANYKVKLVGEAEVRVEVDGALSPSQRYELSRSLGAKFDNARVVLVDKFNAVLSVPEAPKPFSTDEAGTVTLADGTRVGYKVRSLQNGKVALGLDQNLSPEQGMKLVALLRSSRNLGSQSAISLIRPEPTKSAVAPQGEGTANIRVNRPVPPPVEMRRPAATPPPIPADAGRPSLPFAIGETGKVTLADGTQVQYRVESIKGGTASLKLDKNLSLNQGMNLVALLRNGRGLGRRAPFELIRPSDRATVPNRIIPDVNQLTGERLGGGVEGSVYVLKGDPSRVVKIYRRSGGASEQIEGLAEWRLSIEKAGLQDRFEVVATLERGVDARGREYTIHPRINGDVGAPFKNPMHTEDLIRLRTKMIELLPEDQVPGFTPAQQAKHSLKGNFVRLPNGKFVVIDPV